MKRVKEEVKRWSGDRRRKLTIEKANWMQRMEVIDKVIEEGYRTDEILAERLQIFSKIIQSEKKQHDDIAQKYKNKWCLEGDENSVMFHRNLNKKKPVTAIKGVEIDGVWETDPNKVKDFLKFHSRITSKVTLIARGSKNWEKQPESQQMKVKILRNYLKRRS